MSEYLARLIDYATDPRSPHNILSTMYRSRKFRNTSMVRPSESRLLVALTFDVEREYGSTLLPVKRPTERQFLQQVGEHFPLGTIFIQGNLVKENVDRLRSLQNALFEVGLHGYNHELWGQSQWYLSDRPVPIPEKDSLVKTALNDFSEAGLDRPRAFRAPNLTIDDPTLEVLARNGFTVDSSLPSHKGHPPIPILGHDSKGLTRIPVSTDPIPDLRRRVVLPYLRYRVFNLKILKELTSRDFLLSVTRIITLQNRYGVPAHLVINSHSWEFYEPAAPAFKYCSETNFEFLHGLTKLLAENYELEHVTVTTLSRILLQNMGN